MALHVVYNLNDFTLRTSKGRVKFYSSESAARMAFAKARLNLETWEVVGFDFYVKNIEKKCVKETV